MSVVCGTYHAAFALDDPDALVEASLCCPACLAGDSAVEVGVSGPELAARCFCADCGSTWSLHLAPQQLLRLSLDPPAGALVRFGADVPAQILPPDPEERRFDVP